MTTRWRGIFRRPGTVWDRKRRFRRPWFPLHTDIVAPVVASASIAANGTTITIAFTETGSPPILPASGATGFTLSASGGAVSITGLTISGTTGTGTLSRTLDQDETVTLSYTSGNVTDTRGNALATFASLTVTNNSTQDVTPPSTPTGLVAVAGDAQVTLTWNDTFDADRNAYRVYRDGVLIDTLDGDAETYLDTGLNNTQVYVYQLTAIDEFENESAPTVEVEAEPSAAADLFGTRSGGEKKCGRTNLFIYENLNDGAEDDSDTISEVAASIADDLVEANTDMKLAWREFTSVALGHSNTIELRWLNDTAEYGMVVKAWNGRNVSLVQTQDIPQQVATAIDEWTRRLEMLRTGAVLLDYMADQDVDDPSEFGAQDAPVSALPTVDREGRTVTDVPVGGFWDGNAGVYRWQ